MPLKENLEKAHALKQELDSYRPLTPEMEKRIMQKFRLDWNYHSSNIEGNALTYGETKALILFGTTAQAKPLKDHLEMTGHDEAIKYIEEIIKQERPLTEHFIRELHKLLLKEPYEVDAITPDGQPTRKRINIGQYKTTPNHVLTVQGEIFYFATPEETPAKMQELMDWYKKTIKKKKSDFILFATEFHYRFIRIHPFDDGNGRIARLLMNFILMQKGYPPAIIKTEDKKNYFAALQQADAGDLEYFFNYICEHEIESLELMISGARGEEIEDEDDLDKKLALLKQKLGHKQDTRVKVIKDSESIKDVIEKSINPFLVALESRMKDFDSFFKSRKVTFKLSINEQFGNNFVDLFTKFSNEAVYPKLNKNQKINKIEATSNFYSLRESENHTSLKGVSFTFSFYDLVYEITLSGTKKPVNKLYDEYLSELEINNIVKQAGNWLYKQLEEFIANQTEKN